MKLKEFFKARPAFVGSFPSVREIPASREPEIAFAGRSNVGKSSLINAVFSAPGLAKTSATPGRTQMLNFFSLAGRLMIVDLPGYGFAKAPKRAAEAWNENVRIYLKGRSQLKRLFLLVDARQGPKPADEEMMAMLDAAAVGYQITLTKTDKASEAELASAREKIAAGFKSHAAMHPLILESSSETGSGLDEIRGEIFDMATQKH
ncbi:MAG: ribosome biogenesis GTP-binding protein YihA/YsxC [Rickettsiales bacterium]|jgi:GTP-binding protein|nr:ribosome biogenesis GTP-binding protein YihA/YsxC [Rickettsiales bacterium]